LKLHSNSETPYKKPKGGELGDWEKSETKRISRERILIENILHPINTATEENALP